MFKTHRARMDPVAPMTVAVLRELLLRLPGDAQVILASDAEENNHRPLLEVYRDVGPIVVLVPFD